ncbi:MAG TPA: hypothetical protein VK027_04995 [Chitinophagaceae bacterium]|nr:hypothetical protein [Chitinophagaceae bacterium]
MSGEEVIELIGFDRTIHINSKSKLESEYIVPDKIRNFSIDSVYFNIDESGNKFPAVFLKKVQSFDEKTLHEIADIHKKIWNYKKVLFLYVYSDTEIRIYNCFEKPFIKTKEDFDFEKAIHQFLSKAKMLKNESTEKAYSMETIREKHKNAYMPRTNEDDERLELLYCEKPLWWNLVLFLVEMLERFNQGSINYN